MNKLLLTFLALGFAQGTFATEEGDKGPSINVNGRTFKLDPIEKIKFRPLKKMNIYGVLGAQEPNEFEGLPRVIDLKETQTSVKNQGDRGSCTFFATSAFIESMVKEKQGQEINMSEEYFTWITKAKMKYFTKTEGSRAEYNAEALKKYGLMLEQDMLFQPTYFAKGMPCEKFDQNDTKTPAFCYAHNAPNEEQLKKVIPIGNAFKFATIDSDSIQMVKNLAALNHPIVIGVPVHPKGWSKPDVQMTDEMMKECQAKPGYCGGHAVLVTGYDLDKRVFTFKNSWGTDWGNVGYGTISFDYIDQSDKRQYLIGDMVANLFIPEVSAPAQRDMKITDVTAVIENNVFNVNVKLAMQNVMDQSYQVTVALLTKDEQQNYELIKYLPQNGQEAGSFWANGYYLVGSKPSQVREQKYGFTLDNLDKESLKGRTEVFARISTYYVDDNGEKRVERQFVKVDFPL